MNSIREDAIRLLNEAYHQGCSDGTNGTGIDIETVDELETYINKVREEAFKQGFLSSDESYNGECTLEGSDPQDMIKENYSDYLQSIKEQNDK